MPSARLPRRTDEELAISVPHRGEFAESLPSRDQPQRLPPPDAWHATVAVGYLQITREFLRQFRGSPVLPCRWLPTLIAVMAGLLFIVSPMEPGRYVYLKYGVARSNGDVILDRRKKTVAESATTRRLPNDAMATDAIATSRASFRRSVGRWCTGRSGFRRLVHPSQRIPHCTLDRLPRRACPSSARRARRRVLHSGRVEGRPPAALVIPRELKVVALVSHADRDPPDARPRIEVRAE